MVDTTVLAEGLTFVEGPRWHDDRLWVSDFFTHRVLSVGLDGETRVEVDLGNEQPSGLGWLPDGRLLVSAMTQRKVLRREADGTLVTHADLGDIATFHCNDMIVDTQGRAYVGNFGFDLDSFVAEYGVEGLIDTPGPITTSLALVHPDGSIQRIVNDLAFPNGMVITPDGSTLIVAQTLRSELTAFSIRDDGTVFGRRPWAELMTDSVMIAPDGIALDADGGVWVADALGSGVVRVIEGGEITHQLVTSQPAYACALGGPEQNQLIACTAPSATAAERAASREGKLEVVEVDFTGAGVP